jgi:hypothetical protein
MSYMLYCGMALGHSLQASTRGGGDPALRSICCRSACTCATIWACVRSAMPVSCAPPMKLVRIVWPGGARPYTKRQRMSGGSLPQQYSTTHSNI